METWCKTWCPKCGTKNWICQGDWADMTTCDTEACKCHACDHVYPLVDPEEGMLSDDPDDWYVDDGVESPD